MNQQTPSRHLALLALLMGSLQPVSATPLEVFSALPGFWIGPGRIEFVGGTSEALVCKAYYATTDPTGRLSIVLRCASPSQKIELRAQLVAQGPNLTGIWEERTYNASGTVTGQATDRQITLSVDGGGFTATMLVVQDGEHQSVSIATQGVGFTKVSVSLTRGANDKVGKPGEADQ
jgi:hypothetical protein